MWAPLLAPLRALFAARADVAGVRAVVALLTALLLLTAAALLSAAGLVALTDRVGFPVAALVGAALFSALALAARRVGRAMVARKMARVADAQKQAETDIAVAAGLGRSAGPLLPLAVLLGVFFLTRRS